jgi:hypothetical protein
LSGTLSGKTSISLTMKSASVPEVATRIFARIGPAIVTLSVSGSVW